MKFVDPSLQCPFMANKGKDIDYKNAGLLLSYVDYFGKIKKSYYKGISRRYQAKLAQAIKRARHMGLMAFVR